MNNFTWQHIEFDNSSNPYICMTEDNFNKMKERYNLINIKDNFWLAEEKNFAPVIDLFNFDSFEEDKE